jgi:hypothetical protein
MLQSNDRALDYVVRVLEFLQDDTVGTVRGTGEPARSEPAIELRLHDRYPAGEPVAILARVVRGRPEFDDLVAEVAPAIGGGPPLRRPMAHVGDASDLVLPPQAPAVYRVKVETVYQGPGRPEPIEDFFEVGGPV